MILFIISEQLPNLVHRTHSSIRNLTLLRQAINPESVLRCGNSLGPVPEDKKAGKLLFQAVSEVLKETKVSLSLLLPCGKIHIEERKV